MPSDIRQLAPADFPALLREIPDAPQELFVRGSLPPSELTLLTVVGSRKYTAYGKQACEHLISGLRGYPVGIVSGLALGIDAIAHKAALDADLYTMAVPGSGLDERVLYPRSNVSLARAILESGGGLLSEFAPNFKATKWGFPQRNRIMAGIAHATLLIEAGERSGTLITARLTAEYNRELLVVPGSIFNESSKGALQFLKLGATPVADATDILNALNIDPRADGAGKASATDVSDEEQAVLALLASPLERDTLIAKLDMPAADANSLLSMMEIRGLIQEESGIVRHT